MSQSASTSIISSNSIVSHGSFSSSLPRCTVSMDDWEIVEHEKRIDNQRHDQLKIEKPKELGKANGKDEEELKSVDELSMTVYSALPRGAPVAAVMHEPDDEIPRINSFHSLDEDVYSETPTGEGRPTSSHFGAVQHQSQQLQSSDSVQQLGGAVGRLENGCEWPPLASAVALFSLCSCACGPCASSPQANAVWVRSSNVPFAN